MELNRTKQTLSGADILIARRRAGLTQERLATALGIDKRVLVAAEREGIDLSQAEYRRILEAIKRIAERRKQESAA